MMYIFVEVKPKIVAAQKHHCHFMQVPLQQSAITVEKGFFWAIRQDYQAYSINCAIKH